MRRFIAVIMTMGLVYLLCGAPNGVADEKTFIMGYDPTGPTCHLGQYAALAKGFFAEEGLRVRGIAALDNRTAVSEGRSHRLWVKTDAGLSEADFGYSTRTSFITWWPEMSTITSSTATTSAAGRCWSRRTPRVIGVSDS